MLGSNQVLLRFDPSLVSGIPTRVGTGMLLTFLTVQKAATNYFTVRARKRFYLGGFDDHGGDPAEHVGEEGAKGLHEVGVLSSRAKHTASLSIRFCQCCIHFGIQIKRALWSRLMTGSITKSKRHKSCATVP
jgi:hypothetical protein